MSVQIIQRNKKAEHSTDQVEMIISILCMLEGIHLSETQNKCLSYFIVYGLKDGTEDMLIKAGIVPNKTYMRNLKTKLCKLGFLKREAKERYRNYELALTEAIKNFKYERGVQLRINFIR